METLLRAYEGLGEFALRENLQQDGERALSAARDFLSADPELSGKDRERVLEEWLGNGPLKPFLADASVTEILVNGPEEIWIERSGTLAKTDAVFFSAQSLERYVKRLLHPIGRRIDRKSPFVDARLLDGSRVNAAWEPAVFKGAHLCIRKFPSRGFSLEGIVSSGAISEKGAERLRAYVKEGKNIFVSGATGSGKTTMLAALAAEIPAHERILCLEDVAELRIEHPHVVKLEGRPANLEGEGEIDLRQMIRQAMRMRPDRILVGECRGREALDLLQALNTGHRGSMGTIHANSARDALSRLEVLALLEGKNLNPESVRSYINSAIQVIVHLERKDGRRVVRSVEELKGVQEGVYLLRSVDI